MKQTYKVLSIDAWREEDSWTWNQWFDVGSIEVCLSDSDDVILQAMLDAGYIRTTEGAAVEDDQHNLVICDPANDMEPIFAIEYGSAI